MAGDDEQGANRPVTQGQLRWLLGSFGFVTLTLLGIVFGLLVAHQNVPAHTEQYRQTAVLEATLKAVENDLTQVQLNQGTILKAVTDLQVDVRVHGDHTGEGQ